ncbi:MAG: hypothetical protein HZB39_18900 [Planctomycetes bacterium]|nr:hypothetical protein [Planctomycetota bacterium]
MSRTQASSGRWIVAGLVLAVVATVAVAAILSSRLPDGPVDPVWDQQACAHCRMHVGEPRFAAQLQTAQGDVWFYDDPGCLAEHLADARTSGRALDVHAIFFRHLHESRWVGEAAARFVPVSPTPMGFGFGVVDSAELAALDYAGFLQRVAARDGGAR